MVTKTKTYLPPKPKNLVPMGTKNPETVNEALAGPIPEGETRTGFLGKGNTVHKADYLPSEALSAMEKQQKKLLQDFLGKTIEPVSLSMKSTGELDKRALVNKLRKSMLTELLRLVPERIKSMTPEELEQASRENTITEEEKAEIQSLYLDVSP